MKSQRIVRFDLELQLEAYYFKGLEQQFPNHFHDYYVIGLIDNGQRYLTCREVDYVINPNDLILFNPYDNHACKQVGDSPLHYRSLHITRSKMQKYYTEVTESLAVLPFFDTVVTQYTNANLFRKLHQMIIDEKEEIEKEEIFYFLIENIMRHHSNHINKPNAKNDRLINCVRDFIHQHYHQKITLNELSQLVQMNKYTLLRAFTKQQGITPYQYLETIRLNEAKKQLEQGLPLLDISLNIGFSDQSHFTRFFKQFIGVTPKQYQNIFTYDNTNFKNM